MNIKHISSVAALCLLAFSVHSSPSLSPQVCPSVDAIRSVGVTTHAAQDSDYLWFTGRSRQRYDTQTYWMFIIGQIPAATAYEAYQKATTALNSLAFELGPVMGPMSKWICYYRTNEGYAAMTLNTSLTEKDALEG